MYIHRGGQSVMPGIMGKGHGLGKCLNPNMVSLSMGK